MDAAVARPFDPQMVSPEVLGIGIPSGTADARLDMPVRKSGRTTGVTEGTIEVLNATVNISYGDNQAARFENQIITSAMCMGGDSGSVLFSAGTTQVLLALEQYKPGREPDRVLHGAIHVPDHAGRGPDALLVRL